jgi:hypothetical protein
MMRRLALAFLLLNQYKIKGAMVSKQQKIYWCIDSVSESVELRDGVRASCIQISAVYFYPLTKSSIFTTIELYPYSSGSSLRM